MRFGDTFDPLCHIIVIIGALDDSPKADFGDLLNPSQASDCQVELSSELGSETDSHPL